MRIWQLRGTREEGLSAREHQGRVDEAVPQGAFEARTNVALKPIWRGSATAIDSDLYSPANLPWVASLLIFRDQMLLLDPNAKLS